ncbi:MAG: ABC transporter substrate-binding protein, partial [Pseudomonadota bacterium]
MKRQFANVATHARLAVHKAITLLVLFASGLSGAGAAETLRMVVPSDPGFIDPAYWGSSVDQYLIDNLFPRLFKPAVGDEWRFELDAAKSVDTSDPLKIAFELKPGIMWTGGYGELTADDVKFSYERHLDEDVASYISTEFTAIREVEVTGKYTGIVHLNRPSKTLIPSTLGYTGGAIVSRAAIDSEGGFFEAVPTATAGPYRIKSFEPGQNLVLEKDPAWNGEQGDFEEIVLVPIADENAATLAFAAGEVDLTFDSAGNYENLKAAPPEGGKLQLFQSLAPL